MKTILKKGFTLIEMTIIITVISFLAVYGIRLNTQSEETMKRYNDVFANKRIQAVINREIGLVASYKLDRSELSFTKDGGFFLISRQRNELVKKASGEVFSIEEIPFVDGMRFGKVTGFALGNHSLKNLGGTFEEEFDNLQIIISRDGGVVYLGDGVNLSEIKIYLKTDFTPKLIFERKIGIGETKNIEITNCSIEGVFLTTKDKNIAEVYFDEIENTFKITGISSGKTKIINNGLCNLQSSNLIIEVN